MKMKPKKSIETKKSGGFIDVSSNLFRAVDYLRAQQSIETQLAIERFSDINSNQDIINKLALEHVEKMKVLLQAYVRLFIF